MESGPSPVAAGGFVKGATLLDGVSTAGTSKGATVSEPATGVRPKHKTVFDPGVAAPQTSAGVAETRRLVGWLVTFSHKAHGEDFHLREGRNVIGSDSDCDIVVGQPMVSGKHAVIMVREGKFQIRDNDSTNGTYVNGDDIFGKGAVVLQGGDKVRIGDSECVLYAI